MQTLRVVFLWLTLISPAFAAPTLLVVGDSLSAGYRLDQGQLGGYLGLNTNDILGTDVQVLNASISGETTTGGLHVFLVCWIATNPLQFSFCWVRMTDCAVCR